MKLVLIRSGHALYAVDTAGDIDLQRIAQGKEIMCEIKQARNPRFHRFAFALFNAIAEGTGDFTSLEALRTWFKIRLGYADPIIGPDGKTHWVVRSLSFEKMDEADFREFFERAIDLAVKTWGFERPDLLNEIEGRTGLRWSEENG